CWDLQFPEVARMLTLQGAEVIFMPIWGGNLILARARAIENQIYLVSSSYGMKTGMFNLEGKLIAEATDESPVAVVTVDLNKQMLWPWLGDLKNRIPREIPGSKMIAY
ncbi:MAG: carbon-nitrogen hydrolase family protein, partial [Bacteroidales bacterium]|nr:carbon-nitrogen hydrolase family protein [Bacteroidales bacterium]